MLLKTREITLQKVYTGNMSFFGITKICIPIGPLNREYVVIFGVRLTIISQSGARKIFSRGWKCCHKWKYRFLGSFYVTPTLVNCLFFNVFFMFWRSSPQGYIHGNDNINLIFSLLMHHLKAWTKSYLLKNLEMSTYLL